MENRLIACLVVILLLLLWYWFPKAGLILAGALAGYAFSQWEIYSAEKEKKRSVLKVGGNEETPIFSYYLPPKEKTKITAMTISRVTPTQTIITPYYKKGDLYITNKKVARAIGYNLKQVVHSEDQSHNEKLHTPNDPYAWHGHIEVPNTSVKSVLTQFMVHYGPKPAERHIERMVKAFEEKTEAREFSDGARLVVEVCTDKSGLEFMINLRRKWGDVPPLTEEEKEWVTGAVGYIRPCTGKQVVELLLKRFHPSALLTWEGYRGGLQHYLARVGCVDGLELLANSSLNFDVNMRSKKDNETIAGIGRYNAKYGNTTEEKERGMKVVKFVEKFSTMDNGKTED